MFGKIQQVKTCARIYLVTLAHMLEHLFAIEATKL